jgi:thiol-disulfide isomerase/thioredoxin
MQMQHPMFCGTLLYKFFGGPAHLDQLVQTAKGAITYGPDVTIDSEPCKTVKFFGTGLYGHAQVAISTGDGLVRRIVYDSAPLMTMMRQMANGPEGKKIPKKDLPTSSKTTEVYSKLAVDQDVAANAFDVTVPKGLTTTDMTADDAAPTPPVKIGDAAPDFTVTSLGGKRTVQLSSLRGKVVMVDFWATWCPPCRRSLPETQKLAAQYAGKGLVVMAISDETKDTITKFVATNHYTFPTYRDVTGGADKAYKINAIPTLAIIDGTGHLSAFFVGLQDPSTVRAALKKAGLATE